MLVLISVVPLFAFAQSSQWKFTYEGFLEEAGFARENGKRDLRSG